MTRISNDFSSIPESYRADCREIVEACKRRDLIITPEEAYTAWGNYSDSMAAGWMGLPTVGFCSQSECDRDIECTVMAYC